MKMRKCYWPFIDSDAIEIIGPKNILDVKNPDEYGVNEYTLKVKEAGEGVLVFIEMTLF